jgi:hypothetical protein
MSIFARDQARCIQKIIYVEFFDVPMYWAGFVFPSRNLQLPRFNAREGFDSSY